MAQAEVLTNELQFHLLRHFERVDDDYLDAFLSISGYTWDEVREQLEMKGSRFHYAFAPNPLILWEKISAMMEMSDYRKRILPGRKVFSFHFDREVFPQGIGLCYLVSVDHLEEEERKLIKKELRGENRINVIEGIQPIPTWELHMVEVTGEEGSYIATIFPGTYAPPFPDSEVQPEEEFKENSRFWENHAIIKT
jgi:hypothetical protein